MARARNIKPGFFTNDVLAELPPLGRLLFAGLWTVADRAGRLEDRPRKIKAELLPYDDCHLGQLLDALAERGFIERYEVGGVRYIQITNFEKHQNPHIKEADSVIPGPVSHPGGLTDELTDKNDASTVQAPDEHRASPADSLNPITDSLNRIPDTKTARTRESSGSEPFDALVALCEATGADVAELSGSVRGKQANKAKQLLADGMSVADIGRCAGYCSSQSWRTGPVDMFTVEKERSKWEMAGKPAFEQGKAPNGRASPGRVSNYDQSAANIMGEGNDYGASGPVYETTGRIAG